jgi:PhnB protein
MNSKAKPIPDGYHTVTPYILVNDVPKALEFYKRAFGAEELLRLEMKPGQIAHAELKIGNSVIMISGITPQSKLPPNTGDSRHVCFMMYVNDVDAVAKTAIAAGMKVVKEVQDQFYGDRTGTFEDPFGHVWSIGTHIEDVPTKEATKRMQKLYGYNS